MIDFVLPSLGADMDEAMLVGWLVKPGEEVHYGQVIAEVETDKGVIEVECWHDGVVEELLRQPGQEKLAVGTPLARISLRDEITVPSPNGGEAGQDAGEPPESTPVQAAIQKSAQPPIRHLAHTLGVSLDAVEATGPDGSITREDVRAAAAVGSGKRHVRAERHEFERRSSDERARATPRARALAGTLGVDLAEVTPGRIDRLITYGDVEAGRSKATEPVDRVAAMRKAITRSMTRSKREIPHYYLATHIDMFRSLRWLDAENERRPITSRILPAVLLLKATALAAREVPELNGHWVDGSFIPSESIHVGVAISQREGGLVAPAIHDADSLPLGELMEKLRDLVVRARSWRIRSSEMSDPTITLTNLGDRGVETAFPVIIPPQVAMVGIGKVVDSVVAVEGEPVVHPVVHASLAADHRVTDGHTGGLFLASLDRLLQEPEQL